MTLLAAYNAVLASLAKALEATQVEAVTASLDELGHIKLHARQIRDRKLLADATECQMRVERRLGELLSRAEAAGQLRKQGARGPTSPAGEARPATLKEIGVDPKLSMKARRAAALGEEDFAAAIAAMRTRMASNKAILVDPVAQGAKEAELGARRAAHAARSASGGCVADLGRLARSGYRARFVGMDPQWKFLTRSVAGEGRSANVHYRTEEVDKIKNLPVGDLVAEDGLLAMWMVDWCPQDALDLIAHYGLQHVTTLYTWIKTNGREVTEIWEPSSWHLGQGYWSRANPEACWLATRANKPKRLNFDVRQLIIAPVMEHSRKPDEWLERSERLVEGPYLELQARRTRPGWMSWGDELPAPLISGVGTATGATPSSSPARDAEEVAE